MGGYVLIAMNDAETIKLDNLRLIRGQNLYEGQYALLVMSNYIRNYSSATLNYTSGLRQLQLSSLTGTLDMMYTNKQMYCTYIHTYTDPVGSSKCPGNVEFSQQIAQSQWVVQGNQGMWSFCTKRTEAVGSWST